MLTTGRLVGAAISVGAAFIFFLDMTPIRGAADGAAYGVVIAMAGYFGKRAVIRASLLAAALTVLGPLLGAEDDETLLQIISGRVVGLVVLAVLAGALLHLLESNEKKTESEEEVSVYHKMLLRIVAQALSDDTPLLARLEIITELIADTLNVDRACVARWEAGERYFRLYEIWDRRVSRHFRDLEPPANINAQTEYLIENDFAMAVDDVRTSAFHQGCLEFYEGRKIRALLHTSALYRGQPIGSLIVSCGRPRHWTDREIVFAKSVAHVVALLFAVDQSEKTLERLDLVSQGIFVESESGKIDYANHAARELTGCMEADRVPAIPFTLPPLEEEGDRRLVFHNGRELEVHRRRLPDGQILIRIDDVTAHNAAMAEAKRMEMRLEESAKLQAMGQLAAGVAHDFNNLLSAIMGFGQLLARALEGRPAERVFAERILGVCKKGKGLIEEILAFARTSAVEKNTFDIGALLANPLDVIPDELSGVAYPCIVMPQEPMPVSGNAVQLAQLLQNLVLNASHACEGGEGRITISAGRVTAEEVRGLAFDTVHERLVGEPDAAQDYCFLRVADNGHGIAPENLSRIFEPFFTTKGRRRGSGLGLAVVHGVVKSHGGCCHVRSEIGKGTTFTIYLPLLSGIAPERAAPVEEPAATSSLQGTEKVMVVDDDIDLAEALTSGLAQLGYDAVAFEDPLTALAALRQHPDDFDVLVTDHFMPKMHGVELVAAVRSSHNAIRIVLCSGANMPGLEDAARAAGADAFMRKPITPADIAFQIRSVLRDRTEETVRHSLAS